MLDASVTASWFFPDESHSVAAHAWLIIHQDSAIVPRHWWFEVRNTMLTGERSGRTNEKLTSFALDRLARMTIRDAPNPLDADVFALARRHRLTFYDAAYLELARREGLALATLDGAIAVAARRDGVPLISGSQ